MNVEITRFKVRAGKRKQVDEWLAFLNENMSEVLLTLEKEKMYVETIFREVLEGQEFLYWYSVQGDGGQEVEESTHWIDKKHLDYWKECIDPTFAPVKLTTEVVMIPDNIRQKMQ
ncbi:hypothetical protein OMQ_02593 [Enterococcus saccharolyticus subsp. saccharolyticus ATCC 43076]|uniref:NIPSNAP domain-containing protein n=2 Tax=Enterococcus saccharolyticus TaxID=41997 RepID=S0JFG3_9ENTE|nr:hypothetical protein OMQ_02593 [Enterococcus saccharolyticus subsp. saccharolyticus ATCC 43076]EOT83184.1 hypothetical protein I572_00053 [Enterococcus saccharolyticus subsp. saccharolyticus ATCC 43076]